MNDTYKKVINVCKEMFSIREYVIFEEGEWYLKAKTNKNLNIFLYIITSNKLNIDIINYYYSILITSNIKHAILIYQNTVTPSVKKVLENVNINIELFCIDELQYNIINHILVPEHIKIDNRKRNDKKYPVLKRNDAVSRFMGFKHGDIIKINRKDGTIYYRFVK